MSRLRVSKYSAVNNAPVLVLLHGWGSSSKIWQPCAEQLSKAFDLWCIDLPGHGENQTIDWDESVEQGVELLANTLPEKCMLIGWSLGGLLAQQFVSQYPDRVQSLMLVASTPKFVATVDWPHAMPLTTFTSFAKQFAASPQATMKQFAALQALRSKSSKQIMQALEHASAKDLKTIAWGLRWLQEADLRETCLAKDIPITLLQGENDQVSSLTAAEHTVEIWERVQLYKIANAGHAPFLSHPQQFIDQVKTMLAQIES